MENKKPTTTLGGMMKENVECFIPRKVNSNEDFWHNMCVSMAITFVGLMIVAMFIG